MLTKTKGKKMNINKIVCTYCKSDNIEYIPDPFQGQSSWVRTYYKQNAKGGWDLVALGSKANGKNENNDNVIKINRSDINFNDSRPWFNCNACSAELDGYSDVNYLEVQNG